MSEPFADGAAVLEAREVILYGAGGVGRDVCRVLTESGIRVICMLDRQARGDEDFLGVPIYPVESCPVEPSRRAAIPLVLSIFNREVDLPALALAMRSLGFTQVVSFVDLHALFPDALGDRFWLTHRRHLDAHLADIADAERVWADEDSRALYRSLIALRRGAEFDARLNPRPDETQYFPSDVPGWLNGTPLRVVDCGAYQGDTLGLMLGLDLAVEASAHFEPDLQNFASLARLVRSRHRDITGPVMLWPCAVSDHSGAVAFRDGLQEASGVSADGGATVTAVALDDVLAGWRPTLIKMDIEGSEVDALRGARLMIAESRPSLAVCVYHRPDHLWRIPLLLAHWPELSGYRYYLRAHGFNGFDTVLYASPGGRPSAVPASTEVRL
jgi:FkbM family methyltransferase